MPGSNQSSYTTPKVAHKDLQKILPPKPDLLESEVSDIDWDDSGSESGAEITKAAQAPDHLCSDFATLEQATHNHMSTHTTTHNEPDVDPTSAFVRETEPRVSIPQIQAPSPTRVNRIGWRDPPQFGKCVPTRQGHKRADNSDKPTTPAPSLQTFKVRTGYKIPKKANTTTNREDGEVTSDDDMPQPMVASKICRPKRARSESPTTELRKAIELLEEADELEQRAKSLREKARIIRQRFDKERDIWTPSQ